ncbi:MAG TPA: 30S ribosomal protein S8 [Chlamydiales bacterium]|jgi:small subunit ribosomal protein S8|nr:30S ribosomal protein S8 [Chlamydiales bacterium]
MAFNDPIAELLTKIRNAKDAQHRHVDLSFSKIKIKILDILKNHGFIENFLVNEEMRKIRVFLRYTKARESVVRGLKRISSSGLRRYIGYRDIPKVFNGMGISILTTPHGVVDGETARNLKTGGEIICTIW